MSEQVITLFIDDKQWKLLALLFRMLGELMRQQMLVLLHNRHDGVIGRAARPHASQGGGAYRVHSILQHVCVCCLRVSDLDVVAMLTARN